MARSWASYLRLLHPDLGLAGIALCPFSWPLQCPWPTARMGPLKSVPTSTHRPFGGSSSDYISALCSPCNTSRTGRPVFGTHPGPGAAPGSGGSNSSCRRWWGSREQRRRSLDSAAGSRQSLPPTWPSVGWQMRRGRSHLPPGQRLPAGEQRLCVSQLTR